MDYVQPFYAAVLLMVVVSVARYCGASNRKRRLLALSTPLLFLVSWPPAA